MKPYSQDEDLELLNKKEGEMEEYLNKILEANIDRITKITNVLNITQKVGTISFFIFLMILGVKLKFSIDKIIWLIVHIPLVISLISFTVMIHMYLKLKDIMDEAERMQEEGVERETNINFGTFISYLCLYALCVNFIIYFVCFSLKMDMIIFASWNMISITVYINLLIFLFYSIFVFPAFIQSKLYFEISFILSYLLNSMMFIVMLNLKLDNVINTWYSIVFIPLFIALSYHFLFSLVNLFLMKGEYFSRICFAIFLAMTLTFSALICARLDGYLPNLPGWVPVLGILLGFKILMLERIYTLICGENKDKE